MKLEFLSKAPHSEPFRVTYSIKENGIISQEIGKLLKKKVEVNKIAEKGDFLSSVFLQVKKCGSCSMILNLKKLNKCIDSKYFKMESLQNVLHMVKLGVWMASVDLKGAYYSVAIHEEYQKYLKFLLEYPLKFIAMPNGCGPAMRAFKKLMKPPLSFLRSEGHLSVIYVDDCYLQGDSFTRCAENVIRTIEILDSLGFYIKIDKSEIIPKQQITFLGVIIDFFHLTITLTIEKKQNILNLCTAARLAHTLTTTELAKLIGNLVASMEAAHYRRLFIGNLKEIKLNLLN